MFEGIKKSLRRIFVRFEPVKPVKELQHFDTVQTSEQAFESINRGVCSIPLEKIVGTVGRYHDFDSRFRPKRKEHSGRLQGILKAMVNGKPMPPISLYQIKDDYFVLDGHHRVTAARELGHKHIQACILELLPGADTYENILYREKIAFRDKAGLTETIDLTELGQFTHLEQQIMVHQEFLAQIAHQEVDYSHAAIDWYRTIYKPLYSMVAGSGLADSFPRRTVDDLCLYISVHQWELSTVTPIADAGPDKSFAIDASGNEANPYHFLINASLTTSADPIESYLWEVISSPANSFVDFSQQAESTSFIVAAGYFNIGVYTVKLTVTTIYGISSTDTLKITITQK